MFRGPQLTQTLHWMMASTCKKWLFSHSPPEFFVSHNTSSQFLTVFPSHLSLSIQLKKLCSDGFPFILLRGSSTDPDAALLDDGLNLQKVALPYVDINIFFHFPQYLFSI